MVSPLLISRGLRKESNNEKKRKRVKRNEIQCMILLDHYRLFKTCSNNVLFMKRKIKYSKLVVRLMAKDLLVLNYF